MASIPPSPSVSAGAECPHCGDRHPGAYTHCPKTGRSLRSGSALVGKVIADRYKIIGVLGEGGMGAVYIAEHLMIGRKVAIKRLHPELAADSNAVQRFQREARAAAATGHEHIVEILDLGYSEDGAPYIVMEHLRGMNLAQVIREESRLPAPRAAKIVGQVLAALDAVHAREIVHRDLKPDNIFLTRRAGHSDYVKVLDFGISKMKHEDGTTLDLTKTGVMMGTPFYMSPEQARGIRTIDPAMDLYAVGVILYECLTGRLPFSGENYHALLQAILRTEPRPPSQLAPGLDPKLEEVVLRSLAKTAGARFPSARAMHAALVPFGAEPLAERETERDGISPTARTAKLEPGRDLAPRTEPLPADGRTVLSPPAGAPTESPRPGLRLAPAIRGARSGAERPNDPVRPAVEPSRVAPLAERRRASEPPPPAPSGPHFFFAASDDWQGERPRFSAAELVLRDAPRTGPVDLKPRASLPLGISAPVAPSAPTPGPVAQTATPSIRPMEPGLKGAFCVATLEHFEERFGEPVIQRTIATLDPAARDRFGGVILPMAWLPIGAFEALLRAVDRTLGTGDGATAHTAGRAVADRETQTTHRLFMQTATPSLAVERIPHFFRIYHARGECRPQAAGPTSVRLELDAGQPESALYAGVFAGFFQRFLELAGAKDVKGNAVSSRAQGDPQTVVALRWR